MTHVDHDGQIHRRRRQLDVILGTEQRLNLCQSGLSHRALQKGHHFGLDVTASTLPPDVTAGGMRLAR